MNGDVSIDLGSAVPYAVERVLALFGRDAISVAAKERLSASIRLAVEQASRVQCIGMDRPVPLDDIYQPTMLKAGEFSADGPFDVLSLLERPTDAVILAGPGAGKTTLMHWAFLRLLKAPDTVPLLFTLRSPEAVGALDSFVNDLASSRVAAKKGSRVVVLVDGYDEIPEKARKAVSRSLLEFAVLGRGHFWLTCRLYYDIFDLAAPRYYVQPFSGEAARRYAASFFRHYGASVNVDDLMAELWERGFGDFLTSPLMLALVCILKAGPLPRLPKNTIGLIRRALDTLTFRWDESKGIGREGAIVLDGEERIRCLMRIAFRFGTPIGTERQAIAETETHLRYLQRTDIPATRLLREIAQWYGILVPVEDGQWAFGHRTIHDFLAARFWVESGQFSDAVITNTMWNTRTAYAACLIPDATKCVVKSLGHARELHVLIECLANNAPFDPDLVARAMVKRLRGSRFLERLSFVEDDTTVVVSLSPYYLDVFSDELLVALLAAGTNDRTEAHKAAYCLALGELKRRARRTAAVGRQDLSRKAISVQTPGREVGPFSPNEVLADGGGVENQTMR